MPSCTSSWCLVALTLVVGPCVSAAAAEDTRTSRSFPEDLEISEYCLSLLRVFQDRYTAYVECLVPSARPVTVCMNCVGGYVRLSQIYTNISDDQMGPGNLSCRDTLLRSDRLMLIFMLYGNLRAIWTKAACDSKS
ncbi:hypothetical protein CRUP_028810 [Coryphaenoides rupestris]|nr:hypothetical protein CRUP_009782 [Coryphaenoides rupestris]KAG7245876.1 hypothetical protein CRUP_028810 [Coryphaenoides rupestris]